MVLPLIIFGFVVVLLPSDGAPAILAFPKYLWGYLRTWWVHNHCIVGFVICFRSVNGFPISLIISGVFKFISFLNALLVLLVVQLLCLCLLVLKAFVFGMDHIWCAYIYMYIWSCEL